MENTVSLVIPAFDEARRIRNCLTGAVRQTVLPAEIVVVDNNSTDGTPDIVREFAADHPQVPVRLLHSQVQGLVPTRNIGLDAAQGSLLGRIDADTVLDPTWVQNVLAALEDADAVTGPVSYYDLPWNRWGATVDNRVRRWLHTLGPDYPFVFGSNMALRATAWRAIREHSCPDVDDEFHEDIDLAVHLHDNGLSVRYDPGVTAGISARRMDSSYPEFKDYTRRYARTYSAHGVSRWYLKAPAVVLRAAYWPVHALRSMRPVSV